MSAPASDLLLFRATAATEIAEHHLDTAGVLDDVPVQIRLPIPEAHLGECADLGLQLRIVPGTRQAYGGLDLLALQVVPCRHRGLDHVSESAEVRISEHERRDLDAHVVQRRSECGTECGLEVGPSGPEERLRGHVGTSEDLRDHQTALIPDSGEDSQTAELLVDVAQPFLLQPETHGEPDLGRRPITEEHPQTWSVPVEVGVVLAGPAGAVDELDRRVRRDGAPSDGGHEVDPGRQRVLGGATPDQQEPTVPGRHGDQ